MRITLISPQAYQAHSTKAMEIVGACGLSSDNNRGHILSDKNDVCTIRSNKDCHTCGSALFHCVNANGTPDAAGSIANEWVR